MQRNLQNEVKKLPIMLNDVTELQPGDILLYRPSRLNYLSQHLIKLLQSFLNYEDGHYDTTHVAIVLRQSDKGPVIAHITGDGYTIQSMAEYDDITRPLLIFRLADENARNELAKIAESNQYNNLQWTSLASPKAFLLSSMLDPDRSTTQEQKSLSTWTFCSKFVIECMKNAARNRRDKGLLIFEYPDIRSTSTPKALESYLYHSPYYNLLCYPGPNALEILKQEIINQLSRIQDENQKKEAEKIYHDINNNLMNKPIDDLEKMIILLKSILPVFEKVKTGWFENTPQSILINQARTMGIFQSYMDQVVVPAVNENEKNDFSPRPLLQQ